MLQTSHWRKIEFERLIDTNKINGMQRREWEMLFDQNSTLPIYFDNFLMINKLIEFTSMKDDCVCQIK